MVERSRVFAIAGFVFGMLAFAFLVASFASPYWVESNKSVMPSGFERMGIWVACFHNYYPTNRPITNKRYEGCWAAMSVELRDLYDHFYPGWMRAVQALVTVSLVQALGCAVLNIIYFIHCFPFHQEKIIVFVGAILSFVSAFFLLICVILFGAKVDQTHGDDWLPHPDSLYLGWAYGFCILAMLLCFLAGMCMMTDFFRMRLESRYDDPDSRVNARYSVPPPPPPSHQRPVKRY